jgi:Lon protease-like protein
MAHLSRKFANAAQQGQAAIRIAVAQALRGSQRDQGGVERDIKKASNEALVNGLSMMSPCGAKEKQALLEAPDLKSRAEMLVAITTIELARGEDAATQIH